MRDGDPVLPWSAPPTPGRVGQHGLEIVMAVAQGFRVQREPVGNRITARVALLDVPEGDVAGRNPLQRLPGYVQRARDLVSWLPSRSGAP